jgi:hypothetical protein
MVNVKGKAGCHDDVQHADAGVPISSEIDHHPGENRINEINRCPLAARAIEYL